MVERLLPFFNSFPLLIFFLQKVSNPKYQAARKLNTKHHILWPTVVQILNRKVRLFRSQYSLGNVCPATVLPICPPLEVPQGDPEHLSCPFPPLVCALDKLLGERLLTEARRGLLL